MHVLMGRSYEIDIDSRRLKQSGVLPAALSPAVCPCYIGHAHPSVVGIRYIDHRGDIVKRTIVIYSLALAGAAFALQGMEYFFLVRVFSTELYIVLIALGFAGLGMWVGHRLAPRHSPPAFEKNMQAMAYLGISEREYEVLELLAEGLSNKEIAERLFVSPNTVKSHLARLYEKLEVSRRTQAVSQAKALRLIP